MSVLAPLRADGTPKCGLCPHGGAAEGGAGADCKGGIGLVGFVGRVTPCRVAVRCD